MTSRNVFAHTAATAPYPEFVSVNRELDGKLSVMVRSPRVDGGAVAKATLDRAKARELGLALIQATD